MPLFVSGIDGRGNTCPTRGDQPVFWQLFKSRYYRLASCLVFPLLMPLILIVQLNFYQVRVIPRGTHMSHKTLAGNMQGTDIDFRNANVRYHERWDLPKSPSCHIIYYHLLSSTIIYISSIYHLYIIYISSIYHLYIIYIIYISSISSIHIYSMYRITGQIGLVAAPRHWHSRPLPSSRSPWTWRRLMILPNTVI